MTTRDSHFSLRITFILLILSFITVNTLSAPRINGVINIGCYNYDLCAFVEKLAESFMDTYPRVQIFTEVLPPEEAIDKLKNGILDMVFTLNYVNFRNMSPYVLAKEGIAFIVNSQNSKVDFSSDELLSIFSGNIKSWNELGTNSLLTRHLDIVGLSDSTYAHNLLTRLFPIFKPSSFLALDSEQDVINYVAENRYAFGFITFNSLSNLTPSVKLVCVDDFYPTLENAFNNQYKLCITYYLVINTAPYGIVKRFYDFLINADNIIFKEYGLLRLKEVSG